LAGKNQAKSWGTGEGTSGHEGTTATAWVEAANGKRRRNPSCQARRADEKGRRGVGTEGLIRAGKVRCRGIYSSGKT